MRKQQVDAIRQVLEAALQSLQEGGVDATSEPFALFPDRRPSSEGSDSEAPVIVVVTGDPKSQSQNRTPLRPASDDQPAKADSVISDHTERKVSHPGLERFRIESDSRPSAPKPCFMEPGRTCVNSGACEMRGF